MKLKAIREAVVLDRFVLSKDKSITMVDFIKKYPDIKILEVDGIWTFCDADQGFNYRITGAFEESARKAANEYCRTRDTKFARLILKDFK